MLCSGMLQKQRICSVGAALERQGHARTWCSSAGGKSAHAVAHRSRSKGLYIVEALEHKCRVDLVNIDPATLRIQLRAVRDEIGSTTSRPDARASTSPYTSAKRWFAKPLHTRNESVRAEVSHAESTGDWAADDARATRGAALIEDAMLHASAARSTSARPPRSPRMSSKPPPVEWRHASHTLLHDTHTFPEK